MNNVLNNENDVWVDGEYYGDDSINNTGSNVTIQAGFGNDIIRLNGSKQVLMYSGYGFGHNATVYGLTSEDTIYNNDGANGIAYLAVDYDIFGTKSQAFVIDKNNVVARAYYNPDIDFTLVDAVGKKINYRVRDYIDGWQTQTVIFSSDTAEQNIQGADDVDYIIASADNSTVNANGSAVVNLGKNVTVNGTDAADKIYNAGSASTVNGGDGDDLIDNRASEVLIVGGNGNDAIDNHASNVSIDGGSGNDVIFTDGITNNVLISGGAGDDNIRANSSASDLTVDGGDGNDIISISGKNNSVRGSTGNDTIEVGGDGYSTVNGGTGNDLINFTNHTKNHVVEYAEGDGNDTVWCFNENDTLRIVDGSIGSTSVVDTNVIVKIGNGSVKLIGMAGRSLNIMDSSGNLVETVIGSVTFGTDKDDTLVNTKNGMIINAGAGNDVVSLKGSKQIVDYVGGNDIVYGLTANDTVRLDETYDPASDYQYFKTSLDGSDIIFVKGHDDWSEEGTEFVVDSRLTLKNAVDKKISVISMDGRNLYVPPAGMKFSGTVDFKNVFNDFDGALVDVGKNNMYVDNAGSNATVISNGDNPAEICNTGDNVLIKTGAADNFINVSSSYMRSSDRDRYYVENITVDAGAGNDYIEGGAFNFSSIVVGDGDDYIRGSGSANTISGGNGADTIISGMSDSSIDGGAGNDWISNEGRNATLNAGAGDDSIRDKGYQSSINAGDGNDFVLLENDGYYSLDKVATINGGKGNDTLLSQTFVDGALSYLDYPCAAWLFEYADGDGNDVIEDKGSQTYGLINLTSGAVANVSGNGDDVVLKIGSGSITFKDRAALFDPIAVKDSSNNVAAWYRDADSRLIKVDDASLVQNVADGILIGGISDTVLSSSVDGNDFDQIINFGNNVELNDIITAEQYESDSITNYGSHVTINARREDEDGWHEKPLVRNVFGSDVVINSGGYIFNSGERVTINSSTENDAIHLNGANEMIFYKTGDGNDQIYGFDETDELRIDGEFSTATLNNDVIVSVGESSIRLMDAADLNLKIFDIDYLPTADTLTAGIEYNSKKPSRLVVKDTFSGEVDAAKISDKITQIDASASTRTLVLKGGEKANVINAGSGTSTLIGGGKDDKFYGGEGENTFVYTVNNGKDAIFDYEMQDIVSIVGATRDQLIFTDKKEVVTIEIDGDKKSKLTVNKVNSVDTFHFKIGDESYAYGSLPYGVTFDDPNRKTALKVGSISADGVTVNAADIVSTAKTIDGSEVSGAVYLIGNNNANVLKAGDHGSTLYGGKSTKAVADKLIGGDGADVFMYSAGDGADVISNFDGSKGDYVVVNGVTSIDSKDVAVSANKVILTIDKQKLTLDDPQGEVKIVDADGKELYKTGLNLPTGVVYNKNKTAVAVTNKAEVETIDLTSGYNSTVKEVNATAYDGAINIVGNGNANVLRAGSGNATLNGSYDTSKNKVTADKLYGSTTTSASDVFVWDAIWGGGDQIYNYSADTDIISITGGGSTLTVDNSDFKISGNKVVLSAGTGKLTINDLTTDKRVKVIYGEDNKEFVYASLPGGVKYDEKSKNKTMKIAGDFASTFDVSEQDYLGTVVTLDASAATGALELIGNSKTKALIGGANQTTLRGNSSKDIYVGGAGSDTFVYSVGGGKDQIVDFDTATDVIKLFGATVTATDFVENKNDVVLKLDGGSITIKDAPRGTINVINGDGSSTSYKTLPTGVTYNAKKEVVTATKDFKGTLDANELGLPVKEINASAATGGVTLEGAASSATKLTAGKGGSSMLGGTGADTMIGGKGVDVFVVGSGDDLVDKYTAKQDKVQIVGSLTACALSGSKDVKLTTSNGSVTIKGGVGKELTVVNGDNEETYKFTKTDTTLDKALVGGSASELAASVDDYWFTQSDQTVDEIGALISESTSAFDMALGETAFDFTPQLNKTILLNSSTRNRKMLQ